MDVEVYIRSMIGPFRSAYDKVNLTSGLRREGLLTEYLGRREGVRQEALVVATTSGAEGRCSM